jgi:hypothetical protein
MTVRTDTKNLLTYTPKSFPQLDAGIDRFITNELSNIQNSIGKIVQVMKMMEDRMNTNGLT